MGLRVSDEGFGTYEGDGTIVFSNGRIHVDKKRKEELSKLKDPNGATEYLEGIGYGKSFLLMIGFGGIYDLENYRTAVSALKATKDISSKLQSKDF